MSWKMSWNLKICRSWKCCLLIMARWLFWFVVDLFTLQYILPFGFCVKYLMSGNESQCRAESEHVSHLVLQMRNWSLWVQQYSCIYVRFPFQSVHFTCSDSVVCSTVLKYDHGLRHARCHVFFFIGSTSQLTSCINCVRVYECLHGLAAQYNSKLWRPVFIVPTSHWSARCASVSADFLRRKFVSGAAAATWNSLPERHCFVTILFSESPEDISLLSLLSHSARQR